VRTPIKAAVHAPIKQAGYISATSGIQKILSCEQQPVHTSGSDSAVGDDDQYVRSWEKAEISDFYSEIDSPHVGFRG
jgi:hypothetical protein